MRAEFWLMRDIRRRNMYNKDGNEGLYPLVENGWPEKTLKPIVPAEGFYLHGRRALITRDRRRNAQPRGSLRIMALMGMKVVHHPTIAETRR